MAVGKSVFKTERPIQPAPLRTAGQAISVPTTADYFLSPFASRHGALVASWIGNDQELTWLAPGTPPPITPQKVADWGKDREHRLLFWSAVDRCPIGYAELNNMPGGNPQMWIGHFIVDPRRRGRSLGSKFARALLARAFLECDATEVLLVVFPENTTAICCYESAGMKVVGREGKFFKATRQEHQFLRMSITRTRYRRLAAAGKLPAQPVPMRAESTAS